MKFDPDTQDERSRGEGSIPNTLLSDEKTAVAGFPAGSCSVDAGTSDYKGLLDESLIGLLTETRDDEAFNKIVDRHVDRAIQARVQDHLRPYRYRQVGISQTEEITL